MLTIFTIPKPFIDPHISLIQRNSLKNWKSLHADIEIIVLGNEAGIADICRELSLVHIPEVKLTEYSTPRLDSAFSIVRSRARYPILMYVNADILLPENLSQVINHIPQGEFLVCGRRYDMDITSTNKEEVLHSPAGMDYFIFRKESFRDMPELVVGRIGWDNWMIWNALKKGMVIIDTTKSLKAIHQNHDYPNYNRGLERKTNPEALQNLSFIKDSLGNLTTESATHVMTKEYKIKKNSSLLRSIKKLIKKLIGR